MAEQQKRGTFRIVGGSARGCRLILPPSETTRPAPDRLRESLFGILEPYLEGARVLDLYAGSGALGLEALSRGAAHCIFVEKDPRAVRVLEKNIASVGFSSRATVLRRDLKLPPRLEEPVDVAFVDPPFNAYSEPEAERTLRGVLAYLEAGRVREGGFVILRFETRKREDAEELLGRFGFTLWREKTYGRSTVKILQAGSEASAS